MTGKAYRVPVRTGSIAELTVRTSQPTTAEEVNEAFVAAAGAGPLAGIIGVLHDGFASARIVGETRSSIVDLPLTSVSDGDLVTVAAWYDNEAGYSMRLAETVARLARLARARLQGSGTGMADALRSVAGPVSRTCHRRERPRHRAWPPAEVAGSRSPEPWIPANPVVRRNLRRHGRTPDALLVDDLLAQDVCVPAVLSEFAQHVEVHPAQRERAAPVAVDHVVQPQG